MLSGGALRALRRLSAGGAAACATPDGQLWRAALCSTWVHPQVAHVHRPCRAPTSYRPGNCCACRRGQRGESPRQPTSSHCGWQRQHVLRSGPWETVVSAPRERLHYSPSVVTCYHTYVCFRAAQLQATPQTGSRPDRDRSTLGAEIRSSHASVCVFPSCIGCVALAVWRARQYSGCRGTTARGLIGAPDVRFRRTAGARPGIWCDIAAAFCCSGRQISPGECRGAGWLQWRQGDGGCGGCEGSRVGMMCVRGRTVMWLRVCACGCGWAVWHSLACCFC